MADAANPSGELPPAAKAAADKAVQKAIQEVSSKSTDGNASGDAAPTTSAEDADDSNRLEEGEIDEKELSEKLQRTVFDNANDFVCPFRFLPTMGKSLNVLVLMGYRT